MKVCGPFGLRKLSSVDGSPGWTAPPIVHEQRKEASYRQLRFHRTQPLLEQVLLQETCATGGEAEC